MPPNLTVLLSASHARHLELALEALAAQSARGWELVVCDHGEGEETAAVYRTWTGPAPLQAVRGRGRASAHNAGLELASGERVALLSDDHLAAPDYLERVAATDGVLVARQAGALTHWWEALVSVVALPRRLQALPEAVFSNLNPEGSCLVSRDALRERFDETLGALVTTDPMWTVLAPLAAIDGLRLPWMLGLTGGVTAPRSALVEAGGFSDEIFGPLAELDLCHRLFRRGERFRLLAPVRLYRQQRPAWPWPLPLLDDLRAFSRRADPVDAHLLFRLLRGDDAATLDAIARERESAGGFELEPLFARVVAELDAQMVEAARGWWQAEARGR